MKKEFESIVVTREFDNERNLINEKRVLQSYDGKKQEAIKSYHRVYEDGAKVLYIYDSFLESNIKTIFDKNNNPVFIENESGVIKNEYDNRGNKALTTFTPSNKTNLKETRVKYGYDDNNRLLYKCNDSADSLYETFYAYDKAGNVFWERVVVDGTPHYMTSSTYEDGKMVSRKTTNSKSGRINEETFIYNDNGDIVEFYETFDGELLNTYYRCEYDENNHMISQCGKHIEYKYEYDANGNMIHSIATINKESTEQFREYDENNRLIKVTYSYGRTEEYKYNEYGDCIYEHVVDAVDPFDDEE